MSDTSVIILWISLSRPIPLSFSLPLKSTWNCIQNLFNSNNVMSSKLKRYLIRNLYPSGINWIFRSGSFILTGVRPEQWYLFIIYGLLIFIFSVFTFHFIIISVKFGFGFYDLLLFFLYIYILAYLGFIHFYFSFRLYLVIFCL